MHEIEMEVRTNEIRPGDFLDAIEPATLYGPRGGKYRFDGVRVASRIVAIGPNDRGRFAITPSTGPAFVLPGNSADLTTAKIRRSASTEVHVLTDDELLARMESDDRSERISATAELNRRTLPSFERFDGEGRIR